MHSPHHDNLPPRTSTWRVLVSPGTTLVGSEIHRALRGVRDISLICAGTDRDLARDMGYEQFVLVPPIEHPDHLEKITDAVVRHQITHIMPAHDSAALQYADYLGDIGALLVAPGSLCVQVCRDKTLTYRALTKVIPVPEIYTLDDAKFPLFVKPRRGQGMRGALKIQTSRALDQWRTSLEKSQDELLSEFVLCEYLPGQECTVDCFTTSKGNLLLALPRYRETEAPGISRLNRDFNDPTLVQYAEQISCTLGLRGPWFFQMRQDKHGRWKLLEVAPRIAGSSAIRRYQGINLPLLALFDASGFDDLAVPSPRRGLTSRKVLKDEVFGLPSFTDLFVDLDDTLLQAGQINFQLAAIVFGLRLRGIRVTLVTKHRGSLKQVLETHGIDGLFDDIRHLQPNESKSALIGIDGSYLLVDDSAKERLECARHPNVIALDPSCADGLWGLLR